RRRVAVALEHPLDDRSVDLLGRPGHAERLRHVARPLDGSHAHHVARRRLGVGAADLVRVALAHVVPHLLGVDDHTVQVEDDRVDHRAVYPRWTYDSDVPAVPSSIDSTSPTKNVWSPVRNSSTVRAVSQPAAPAISRGSSSRTSMPFQRTSGGTER